jgi:hypothetical protein
VKSDTNIRRRAVLIAAVVFLSCAYFYQGGGWNQNSRFDMVRAVAEQNTLRIDAYQENTQDKALSRGHYYSDKAPGLALLALPVAAVARPGLRILGIDPVSPRGLQLTSYAVTVFAVALPAALACACLFLIACELGGSVNAAAFAALGLGLATPMWAYATLFWGHALAGACLVFGFAAALLLRQSRGGDLVWGLVVGLCAGWATVSEYPAAPASAILAILALAEVWPDGRSRRLRTALGVGSGAAACILVLMFYQYRAFGSAIHPSYSYYQEGAFPWMTRGYMGLTYPRVDVMFKLLFGCRRGLLFAAPFLVIAPFGLRILSKQKDPGIRKAGIAAAAIAGYYFLFNASFSAWAGGWSYGPRYMAAGVPLLCVGLAPGWDQARPFWKKTLLAMALCGGLFALMAVSTTAQPPDQYHCPLMQLIIPSFWAGKLALTRGSMLTAAEDIPFGTHGAFNLGQLAGLEGLRSLIPLLVLWGLAGGLWRRLNTANAASSSEFPARN